GETLTMLDKPNNNWLHVQDKNGMQGYVSSSSTYVKLNTVTVTPASNGSIVASVSFRTGATTSASRIRYLQKGEAVWVLEKVNDYWYKVADKNDVIGYISTN